MKIILKHEHLKKLEDIIEQSLSAHQRAQWNNAEARKVIVKLIISKFKKVLGI